MTKTKSLFAHHPWLVAVVLVVLAVGGYFIFRLLKAPAAELAAELKHEAPEKPHERSSS